MGSIIWLRRSLWDSIEEQIGGRAGLAVSREQVLDFANDDRFRELLDGDDDEIIRIRAEHYADAFGNILHGIGATNEPGGTSIGTLLIRDFREHALYQQNFWNFISVDGLFIELLRQSGGRKIKAELAERLLVEHFNELGKEILPKFLEAADIVTHKTPWLGCEEIEWTDIRQLSDLFQSEQLGSFQDKFFDQRFINFLTKNPESLNAIHWRQFEGLVAEFFFRHGLQVEIGPGRGDNNIDIRVWSDQGIKGPPAMIIQCKREARAISKVVVKSLYADMLAEGAELGLVATTSQLSPGAKEVCRTRSYPIFEANKQKVLDWLKVMRKPGEGILMP